VSVGQARAEATPAESRAVKPASSRLSGRPHGAWGSSRQSVITPGGRSSLQTKTPQTRLSRGTFLEQPSPEVWEPCRYKSSIVLPRGGRQSGWTIVWSTPIHCAARSRAGRLCSKEWKGANPQRSEFPQVSTKYECESNPQPITTISPKPWMAHSRRTGKVYCKSSALRNLPNYD
jgi:hypothetical protein